MFTRTVTAFFLTAVCVAACAANANTTVNSERARFSIETVAKGLEHPWGLAFLPDGRMLVTERGSRLRLVGTDGALSEPLTGLPEIFTQRQGGLLDIALDPAFAQNSRVYLTFSEPGGGGAGTA